MMSNMPGAEFILTKAYGSMSKWLETARHCGTHLILPNVNYHGWVILIGSPSPNGEEAELRVYNKLYKEGGEYLYDDGDTLQVALTSDGKIAFTCLHADGNCAHDDCDLNLNVIDVGFHAMPGGLAEYEDRIREKQRKAGTWRPKFYEF
jgi:hypothetical protein